jgi:hypothetical protein
MKAPSRDLNVIDAELHLALKRETQDIVLIGNLLIERKASMKHGEWLPWLKNGGFSMSERSAQNYMRAAKWVAKSATDCGFENLSPRVLYEMSSEDCAYSKKDIDAIMELAKVGRVGEEKAQEIYRARLAKETAKSRAKDAMQEAKEDRKQRKEVAESLREAEKLLDGPPPVLPPTKAPPPANRTSFKPRLSDFDAAVDTILKLSTKSAKKFKETKHAAADLETAADFLRAVAKTKSDKSEEAAPEEQQGSAEDDIIPPHLRRPPIPTELAEPAKESEDLATVTGGSLRPPTEKADA